MPTRRRALLVIAVLLAAGLLSLAGALLVGSYSIAPGEVLARLVGNGGSGTGADIVSTCACRARRLRLRCLLALAGARCC
jgi:ABC-type enterobactin transport system permease subunit